MSALKVEWRDDEIPELLQDGLPAYLLCDAREDQVVGVAVRVSGSRFIQKPLLGRNLNEPISSPLFFEEGADPDHCVIGVVADTARMVEQVPQ